MEFEIDINNIKNRSIFYFKYYCNDMSEFKEWLKYNNIMKVFKEFYYDKMNGKINEEEIEKWSDVMREVYYDWEYDLRYFIWDIEYDKY